MITMIDITPIVSVFMAVIVALISVYLIPLDLEPRHETATHGTKRLGKVCSHGRGTVIQECRTEGANEAVCTKFFS